MTTPTALYSLAFNGYLFGASTPHAISYIEGIESLPDLRTQDDNQGYNDGMFSGRDFLGGRTITFETITFAGDGNTAQENFNLLQAALLPQQQGTGLLQFQLSADDSLKRLNARIRRRQTRIDPEYTYGYIKSAWQLFAPDPRYYDDTEQTAQLLVSPPLGRTYNRTYNLVYGGGTFATSTSVVNNGTVTTYPVVTVTGPITNPIFGNVTTGQYISIIGTISNTDVLVIDLQQRLITLNGLPARNLMTGNSQWFDAPVGESFFYMTGQDTITLLTQATITWRSAYI